MRTEKEIFETIYKIAENDENILAVYLNGSRANPNVPKDIYRDYDIVFAVDDIHPFLNNNDFLKLFGEPAIISRPDLNDVNFGLSADFEKSFTYLMLFKDGTRIDLRLLTKEKVNEEYKNDSLTIPLVDKNNILPKIPPSNDKIYHIKRPSSGEYEACCNEFWWSLNNIAKGIARDELPYAMEMFNSCTREMLNKMIEWYIGINTDFSVSAGKMGKYFKKYLPSGLYDMYKKTYSDSSYDNLWASVFVACDLFRITAKFVSCHLNYEYNENDDKNITEYITKVKNNKLM